MTDDTTDHNTDPAENGEVDTPNETTDPSGDPDPGDKAGKEAARYRVRLRETEAERDQLRGLVETFQRAEAERAVADVLRRPAGLWAAGTNLADLLDDTGRVDPDKAVAAAQAALDQIGLEPKRRSPAPDPSQGRGHGSGGSKTWGEVIGGR